MAPKPRTTASFSDSDSSGIKVGMFLFFSFSLILFFFFPKSEIDQLLIHMTSNLHFINSSFPTTRFNCLFGRMHKFVWIFFSKIQPKTTYSLYPTKHTCFITWFIISYILYLTINNVSSTTIIYQ